MRRLALPALASLLACGSLTGASDDDNSSTLPTENTGGEAGTTPVDVEAGATTPPCTSAPSSSPCALASGQTSAFGIDLDVEANEVVFTRHAADGAILAVPTAGGAVQTLLAWNLPGSIAVAKPDAARRLYWLSESDGKAYMAERLAPDSQSSWQVSAGTPGRLALDRAQQKAFFTSWSASAGDVDSCNFYMSACSTISNETDAQLAIGFDSTWVYYATSPSASGVLARVKRNVTPVEREQAGGSLAGIRAMTTTDASTARVYVATMAGVFAADTANFTASPKQIANIMDATALIHDDATGTLYFVTQSGKAYESVHEAAPQVIGEWPEGGAVSVAQDATSLYWTWSTSTTGGVLRLSK
jgi:hypothetical protein